MHSHQLVELPSCLSYISGWTAGNRELGIYTTFALSLPGTWSFMASLYIAKSCLRVMLGLKVTLTPIGGQDPPDCLWDTSDIGKRDGRAMGLLAILVGCFGSTKVLFHYPPVVTVSAEGLPDVPDHTILVYNRGANGFCLAMKGSRLPPPLAPWLTLELVHI